MRVLTNNSAEGRPGFSLVELSVVLVVIALLILMVLPGVARTKGGSRGFQCLNNNRELNRAWRMWTDDNNDLLLYSSHDGSSSPNNQRAWIISELDFTSNPMNWDPAVSIMRSPMWPYCGTNTVIWRCPSDESYVLVNGEPKPRVRSYSMNFYLGGFAGTYGQSPSSYRLYRKSADIVSPSPDRLFVSLDVRPDSINWGNFMTRMEGYAPSNAALFQWELDWPGFYHDSAATFSYADGHGEIHCWQDLRTTTTPVPVVQIPVPSPYNFDIAWLQDRSTRRL